MPTYDKFSKAPIKNETPWSKNILKSTPKLKSFQLAKCIRCYKAVSASDEIKLSNKVFHKSCLKCYSCLKQLNADNLLEYENFAFCQACYLKKKNAKPAEKKYEFAKKEKSTSLSRSLSPSVSYNEFIQPVEEEEE